MAAVSVVIKLSLSPLSLSRSLKIVCEDRPIKGVR